MYIALQTPVPPNAPPTAPVTRLVRLIDALCAAIAARGAGGVLTVPLFFLLWRRLRRTAGRAIKVAARITAGAPKPVPRPRPTPRPPRPPTPRLPHGFAWVVKVVPGTAAYGSQLQALLADPEMARLAAAPAMRRLLNPLCRMLGVPPPRPAAVAAGAASAPDPGGRSVALRHAGAGRPAAVPAAPGSGGQAASAPRPRGPVGAGRSDAPAAAPPAAAA